jgi:beta-phosphoglucomutase-like phosphatase (HAD superfamily)
MQIRNISTFDINYLGIPKTCKLVIFDLDNILRRRQQDTIDNHIIDILQLLKNNGIKIALASLNKMVKLDLALYGILRFFNIIECGKFDDEFVNEKERQKYKLNTKTHMFKHILRTLNVKSENTIVFDDNWYHCLEARWLKMKYILIKTKYILKWSDLYAGMNLFGSNKKRNSCTF